MRAKRTAMIRHTTFIGILYKQEMRKLLRDHRTVFLSIILPLVVMPVLLFSSRMVEEKRRGKLAEVTYTYTITGSKADLIRALILDIQATSKTKKTKRTTFKEQIVKNPEKNLKSEKLHFFIEALSFEEAHKIKEKVKADHHNVPSNNPEKDEVKVPDKGNYKEVPVPVIRINPSVPI